MALRRWCCIVGISGAAAGCVSKEKDGSIYVDLRGCSATPTPKEEPALGDGPLVLDAEGESPRAPVVSALAWSFAHQEAVHLVLATSPLGCGDVRASQRGFSIAGQPGRVAFIVVTPVRIDEVWDTKGMSWSVVPERETWRVAGAAPGSGVPTGLHTASSADPARGASAKGKRTKLRLAVTEGTRRFAGSVEVEGCGEIGESRVPHEQSGVSVRIGERVVPIRGAIYRERRSTGIGHELRLTSAPSDCSGADAHDVEVVVSFDNLAFLGDAFPASFNYGGHGLALATATPADAGDTTTATVTVSGVVRRPYVAEPEPRSDLERREYSRHVHVSGTVSAIVCKE
jgi:hypothetical protein